jgi:hypothetical protein
MVSVPVNGYRVFFEAIENLGTMTSPEDHRARAATGAKPDALVLGSCHQPCFSQLLVLGLPHGHKGPEDACAPQAAPQSKNSSLTVPEPALFFLLDSMPPRNVAVRWASGTPIRASPSQPLVG